MQGASDYMQGGAFSRSADEENEQFLSNVFCFHDGGSPLNTSFYR